MPVDSMQLAALTAVSPDGKHLYAAETETNSVSVHALPSGGTPCFIDRRTHGERRLRFQDPQNHVTDVPSVLMETIPAQNNTCIFANSSNIANQLQNLTIGVFGVQFVNGSWVNCSSDSFSSRPNDPLIDRFNTTFVCGLEQFHSHDGQDTFVAVASGCESLTSLSDIFSPTARCHPEVLSPDCGYDCCTAIEVNTVGLWDFTEHSVSGARRSRLNTFQGPHSIRCHQTNCSYARPRFRQGCGELHDTWYCCTYSWIRRIKS